MAGKTGRGKGLASADSSDACAIPRVELGEVVQMTLAFYALIVIIICNISPLPQE